MSLQSISTNRPSQVLPGLDLAKALASGRNVVDSRANAPDGSSGSRFGVSGVGAGRDQINLSSQGRALQALEASGQDAATIKAETDILSKLTRQSLSNLVPDASNAVINFDQISFRSSSNTSFQQVSNANGVSSVFSSNQQSSLVGSGQITTADGRTFEFTAELEISQSVNVSQISQGGQGSLDNQAPIPAANGNTGITGIGIGPNATFPRSAGPSGSSLAGLPGLNLQDLIDASDRLLDLLTQANANQIKAGAPSAANNPADNLIKDLLAQLQAPESTDQDEPAQKQPAISAPAQPDSRLRAYELAAA